MGAAAVVLAGVAWAVLKLGRTLPVKRFLAGALVDRDGHVDRRARQRHARPAGGGHHRPPLARRLAEPADLPGPGHGLLPDRCRASLGQGLLLVVVPASAASSPTSDAPPAQGAGRRPRRRAAGSTTRVSSRRASWACASASTSGGTFTKAVGDRRRHRRRARPAPRCPPPTSDAAGLGRGRRARSCAEVAHAVGAGEVELITYSTTQAVNALLEGDVAMVGVLGLGRQPDLRKAAKRTRLDKVELAAGTRLPTVHEFLDLTRGFDEAAARRRPRPARRPAAPPRSAWPRPSPPTAAPTSAGRWSWPSPAASPPAGRRR